MEPDQRDGQQDDDEHLREARRRRGVWRDWLHEAMSTRTLAAVYATARRAGLDDADAEDVVQETAATAFLLLRAGKYRPMRASVRSWVVGIAQKKVLRSHRSRTCREYYVRTGDDVAIANDSDEEEQRRRWDREWARTIVGQALRRLRRHMHPERFRIYVAVTIKQRSPSSIADHYGIQRTTVYNIKSRGNHLLKQLLGAA